MKTVCENRLLTRHDWNHVSLFYDYWRYENFFFDEINIVIYWNMINYFHYITLIDYLYVKLYIKILKAVNLINFNSTVLLRLRIINNQSYCYFYSNIYFCISYIFYYLYSGIVML